MRSDLNKVICEKERRRSSDSYRLVRHKKGVKFDPDEESQPIRQGMRHPYGWDTKDFGEHLSPLYGQIRKAVGRRFDDFYGELCRNFDMSTVQNRHILQHLYDRFEKDCYIRNGEIYVGPTRFRCGGWRLRDQRNTEWYVDPRDGIIRKNPWFRYVEPEKRRPRDTLWIDRDRVMRKVGDIWFIFTMAEVPSGSWVSDAAGGRHFVGRPVRDVFDGRLKEDTRPTHSRFGRPRELKPMRYHAEKRSASKKDLKAAGLR